MKTATQKCFLMVYQSEVLVSNKMCFRKMKVVKYLLNYWNYIDIRLKLKLNDKLFNHVINKQVLLK